MDNILTNMENILDFLQTTEEKMLSIANEVKKARKTMKISQEELSNMSNVSFGSIKRFERTGEISLYSLIKILNVFKMKIELVNKNPLLVKKVGFYNEQ